MGLYSDPISVDSHRVRVVLAEKGIDVEVVEVDPEGHQPEDLPQLNPYAETPTLIDRDLALYDPRVICEYLDERFPHPPLMPIDPVSRAKSKLVISRIERDWYTLLHQLEQLGRRGRPAIRRQLAQSLAASADVFDTGMRYFLSDDITMMDCVLAPILWRIEYYGVELPPEAGAVTAYARRLFARDSFIASLTHTEQGMRSAP
ncbi:glutathione S-transferase N-terminal domain-containing protein [Spiribacter vilamensis]|uniref:glutathione S-transferase N-terminal domain-containing protein n=1 Tax=Spiribacter vilamensis TaxID=531306 RepID=UPI00102BA961|nr:glutathione S-transferase N-terminal domain-containing protein [Spiribacter vilamensis]TVO62350.1 stringent starvation protein A [Spiribacter vilamensis]